MVFQQCYNEFRLKYKLLEDTMKRAIVFLSFILALSMILLSCDKISETTTISSLSTTTATFNTTTTSMTTTTEISDTKTLVLTYEIEFDSNGGNSIDTIQVERGYPALLPVPSKEGYTFDGWYTSEDPFYYEFTLFNQVVNDMTLYAKWNINQYSISYNSNGGSIISTSTFDYNQTLVVESPTRLGHTFTGWFIDEDYLIPFDLDHMPAHDLTLFAKWTTNTYKISYHYSYPLHAAITFNLISMGYSHTIVTSSDNRVFSWGSNYSGQLGDNTLEKRDYPVEITEYFNLNESEWFKKIVCGSYHTLMLTNESRLFGFGSNISFQIATQTLTYSSLPIDITDQLSLTEGETIVDVDSGDYFNILLTSNGRILTWGSNFNGENGIGTNISDQLVHDITSSFNISETDSIIKINAGDNYSIVITEEKRVFTWGFNSAGQLGDGTTTNRLTPVEITTAIPLNLGETIDVISTSHNFVHLVTSSGRIFVWGQNSNGYFGNGNTTSSLSPIIIEPNFELGVGEKINYMSAAYEYVFAISSQYRVFVWGTNFNSAYGVETPSSSNTPIEITEALSDYLYYPVIEIKTGGRATTFISSAGTLATAGTSIYGQLGDTDTAILHTPKIYVTDMYELLYESIIDHDFITFEGYVFDGWYCEVERILLSDYITMPAKDIDLYGIYVKDES